jgi:hypothetical protein
VVIPLLKRMQGRATWISKPILLNTVLQISPPVVTDALTDKVYIFVVGLMFFVAQPCPKKPVN